MWVQLLPFYCYYSIQSQMHTDKIPFEYIKSKIFISCNAVLYNRSWLEKDSRWQQVGGWPFLALAAKQGQVWLAMWKGNLQAKVPCKISWEISGGEEPYPMDIWALSYCCQESCTDVSMKSSGRNLIPSYMENTRRKSGLYFFGWVVQTRI